MNYEWVVARQLCVEKLDGTEQRALKERELKENRGIFSYEIIKMFPNKLHFLKKYNMPSNTGDLFFNYILPLLPVVEVETDHKFKVAGTDLIHFHNSFNIMPILHIIEEKIEIIWAEKRAL